MSIVINAGTEKRENEGSKTKHTAEGIVHSFNQWTHFFVDLFDKSFGCQSA